MSAEVMMVAVALGRAVVQSLWQMTLVGAVAAALAIAFRSARWRYGLWSAALGSGVGWFVWTFVMGMRAQGRRSAAPLGLEQGMLGSGGIGGEAAPSGLGLFELVALLWAVGFVFVAWRTLGQWRWARRLRTREVWAPGDDWLGLFERLRGELGVSRRVRMLVSGAARSPMVVGWVCPVVIVPTSVLTMLSPEQVRLVLTHELAHIRRYDHLVNMLQVLVEAVLFYHPVVWWMSHQMRIEREHCCDDAAVREPGDALVFARALTELETVRTRSRATLGLHQGGSLMKRVKRIMEQNGSGRRGNSSTRALAVLAAGVMIAGAGYAHAALSAKTPREETIEAVRAGVASGVMTEEQARRIYQEVLLPDSWLAERCDQERAYWAEELKSYGLSEERMSQTLVALERDFDRRIEQDFRTRVLGRDLHEVVLSLYAEELERRKQEEGLSAEAAERLYARRVEELNKPPLVINIPEPDGDEKFQHIFVNTSSSEGTVGGTPVRLVEGNTVAGEYEVTEQAAPDGAYKPGQRIKFTPGLPTSVYRVMVGKTEEELFEEQAGASEPAASVEEVSQPLEFTLQRVEPDVFELSRGAEPEKRLASDMPERVRQMGEQVGPGQEGMTAPTLKISNGEIVTGEPLIIRSDQLVTPEPPKLTPADEEYWIHIGVRPLSAYAESDEGC